jgi:phage host-nuclease inhibitor protein Gam
MDQTINELRSRVAKLERENTGSQAQTMQDLITEKILELLAENSEDYIPMIATLSADIRSLKKTVESELKAMKQ